MSVAETIKKIRFQLCLEQHELGKLVGVSGASISQYERGNRKPSLPTIRNMLTLAKENKIDVTVDDFLSD